jgi:hypothetical protein
MFIFLEGFNNSKLNVEHNINITINDAQNKYLPPPTAKLQFEIVVNPH